LLVKAARWLDAQGVSNLTPVVTGHLEDNRQPKPPLTWIGLLLLPLCFVLQLLVFLAGLLVIGVSTDRQRLATLDARDLAVARRMAS
jgi:hypothetical protein